MKSADRPTDVRPRSAEVYFLPVSTRVPLKFGTETLTSVTCLRVRLVVEDRRGRTAEGWGETPLSVQWAWPSAVSYAARHAAMKDFSLRMAGALADFHTYGHPIEVGYDFQQQVLPQLAREIHAEGEPIPYLAALVSASAADLALHDAYGNLHRRDIYETYNKDWMSRDLAAFIEPADDTKYDFRGQYPQEFFVPAPPPSLLAWHLVGGLDPLEKDELRGDEPDDGYPVLLRDWIATDGLTCLKVKLRGNDEVWDAQRLTRVGKIAVDTGVTALSADFNCTVGECAYVHRVLDRIESDEPEVYRRILYVEQPFPYELEEQRLDVRSVAARKPLLLDESAHDWKFVRLGRSLGWSGVALKTCKTQTGALLSLCWAKAHGMPVMVQDLTNPMLAQIPHVRLAADAGTILGVETNAMQFYPVASAAEAEIHPGLYRRRGGMVDLSTISGPGFGYRLAEIKRTLPPPAGQFGNL